LSASAELLVLLFFTVPIINDLFGIKSTDLIKFICCTTQDSVLSIIICGFSLWRQMAPQQSAKFRTAFFGQFRVSLRKDSVSNYASIWAQFSTSVTGSDALCKALNTSQIRLQVAPQDSKIAVEIF